MVRGVRTLSFALALTACSGSSPQATPAAGSSAPVGAGAPSGGASGTSQGGGSGTSAGAALAGAGATSTVGGGGAASPAGGGGAASPAGGGGAASLAGGGSGGQGMPAPGTELWQQKRATLLAIIGRPEVPLAATESPLPDDNGLTVADFSFASDEQTRITGTSFAPKKTGPLPAVIFLHGTGGSRQDGFGLLRTLAGKGFFAVAIDARYHGAGKGQDPYFNAIYQAYVSGVGHPFLYDTVWDVMRLLDYLGGRAEVDAKRIGLVGSSKGGMETYLTAAVEPRVAVAVPWIAVESFAWALDNDQWQARVGSIQGAFDQAAAHDGVPIDVAFVRKFYDRVVPGIYGELDGPAMVPAIAPRPLLAVNGDMDPRTPAGGLLLCEAAAKAAYAGNDDHFQLYREPNTAHAVTAEATTMTVDWFVRWLAP